jgi:hypothetical protein
MRILVLIIASFDKSQYFDMKAIWKVRKIPDMFFIQCKPDNQWIGDIVNDITDPVLKQNYELDILNQTLFVKGDECLIPGILHKTVEAISYFLRDESTPPYDFIWRTNLSSVLDFSGLHQYINLNTNVSGFYGGYVGKASNILFASGAGFLMSRDVALYLITNKDKLDYDLIDDVAIGGLLEPRFGIVLIERCWVQTGTEDISKAVSDGVFHFRCESYLHLRTIEFMNFVRELVVPL